MAAATHAHGGCPDFSLAALAALATLDATVLLWQLVLAALLAALLGALLAAAAAARRAAITQIAGVGVGELGRGAQVAPLLRMRLALLLLLRPERLADLDHVRVAVLRLALRLLFLLALERVGNVRLQRVRGRGGRAGRDEGITCVLVRLRCRRREHVGAAEHGPSIGRARRRRAGGGLFPRRRGRCRGRGGRGLIPRWPRRRGSRILARQQKILLSPEEDSPTYQHQLHQHHCLVETGASRKLGALSLE